MCIAYETECVFNVKL